MPTQKDTDLQPPKGRKDRPARDTMSPLKNTPRANLDIMPPVRAKTVVKQGLTGKFNFTDLRKK